MNADAARLIGRVIGIVILYAVLLAGLWQWLKWALRYLRWLGLL